MSLYKTGSVALALIYVMQNEDLLYGFYNVQYGTILFQCEPEEVLM